MSSDKVETEKKGEIRPPVAVILGHVDHGKTKLLDFIRKTSVVEKEAGNITQHIGAYQADHNGKIITFLDTPGHEAFSAIRARGANVADIAILVVAADEGVKPQTKEAINFIKKEDMPFIVAINKTDKPEAAPEKVKQGLAEQEVLVEGWGGQVPVVELSAKTGDGIESLLEMIHLVSDVEEFTAERDVPAEGVIIESHLDNKRGNIATLLVLRGTLRKSDWVVSGNAVARMKSMEDFAGVAVDVALPSQPVLTLGWNSVPELGRQFKAVASKKEAEHQAKENIIPEGALFAQEHGAQEDEKKVLPVVFKADVRSSLEALSKSVESISHEEVGFTVVSAGVGSISDTDVKAVLSGQGVIFGFYVGTETSAQRLAEKEGVRIYTADVIYELIHSLREELSNMLEPEIKRSEHGKLKVLALFGGDAKHQVVGGEVTLGKAVRGARIDVVRDGGVVATGKLTQLQHKKADVAEVKEGLQCGIRFEGPQVIQEGDILEIYEEEKIKRSI